MSLSFLPLSNPPLRVKRFLPLLFCVLLGLFSLGGLAACGETDASRAASQLQIEDFALTQLEDGTRLFTGKLYNPTDQPVERAQLSVTLFDENNRQIGTTTISIRNIAARDTTSFRQPLDSDKNVSGARAKSITVL